MSQAELLWPALPSSSGYTVPATYATRLGESRFVGRCKVAGCRHRTAVDTVTFLYPGSPLGSVRRYEVNVLPTGDSARPWVPLDFRFSAHSPSAREQTVRQVFEQLGLFCPDHGATVKLRGVRGRIAQNVACTSRCHNAISDTCDCECGGRRHGEAWRR